MHGLYRSIAFQMSQVIDLVTLVCVVPLYTEKRLTKVLWEQAASPPMPQLTARTTPNHSSDCSRTFAQPRRKLPIGYNGVPHTCPQNYTFVWTDLKTQLLPRLSTHPTYHPKPHPCPINRFTTMYWTDRQTDKQTNTHTHTHTDKQTTDGWRESDD